MTKYYSCKLELIEQLIEYKSDNVIWLDIENDFYMIEKYYRLFYNEEIKKEDLSIDQWKICAYVINDEIISFAGVLYMTNWNWEIGAVSTHPQHRNKGYAKCVCSCVAKHILENGKQATCNTEINNYPMIKVLQAIGMVIQ